MTGNKRGNASPVKELCGGTAFGMDEEAPLGQIF